MKFSKRSEYGLRAIINLGIAHSLGRERVSATELAAADNLPLKFLEQIFRKFREAGFIDTQRGKHGGYFIARDPNTIKLGEIKRLLDGPIAPIACASCTAYAPCSCPDEDHCGLRMVMIDVRNAIVAILDKYSVGDVVEVTLRKIRRNGAEHFFQNQNQATSSKAAIAPDDLANPSHGFLTELLKGELS